MSDTPPPVPPAGAEPPAPPAAPQPPYGQPAPQPYGQPGYAPPAYAQQPGYPQPYAAGPATNSLAIVALVLSLSGFIVGLTAIGGIVCGHLALAQIKRTGEAGRGMALAGVIIGYCLVGIGVLLVLGYIIFFVVLFGSLAAAGGVSSLH